MKNPTNRRYDKVYAIIAELNTLGCKTSKEKLLKEFAGGMKEGLRDLTEFEFHRFESFLQEKLSNERLQNHNVCNRQRRKIIGIFAKLGKTVVVRDRNGTRIKPDMPWIYSWVKKYGYLHKPLNDYNRHELPKLVSQVENIQKKEING